MVKAVPPFPCLDYWVVDQRRSSSWCRDMNAEVNCSYLNCLNYCGLLARDTRNTVMFIYLSYGQHVDMRRVRRCLALWTQTKFQPQRNVRKEVTRRTADSPVVYA
jgi:hypothetical protein